MTYMELPIEVIERVIFKTYIAVTTTLPLLFESHRIKIPSIKYDF